MTSSVPKRPLLAPEDVDRTCPLELRVSEQQEGHGLFSLCQNWGASRDKPGSPGCPHCWRTPSGAAGVWGTHAVSPAQSPAPGW